MPDRSDQTRRLEYLDFEIEIGASPGAQQYPVAVLRSPAGEARATMQFPFDRLALDNRLLALQNALLRSGVVRRRVSSPDEQAVQDFGAALFDALIANEIRSRFDTSVRLAEEQGRGLRLKLRINAPELALLPWELLYDSRQGEYVALSRATPIVRYLELPQAMPPLRVAPPLRILGLITSPRDLPPLDIALERQRVEAAIADLRERGLVELTWLEGQTWRDLQRAMRSGPWHVFHFIGHGDFDRNADEGVIALADEQGRTYRLSATQLGRLLDDHFSLRLAILNSCEGAHGSERDLMSSTAATLVRRGIPAVLAMQHEISDDAAIELAHTFYEAIADGLPVDAALAESRKAICLAVPNSVEWSTPVLYLRAPDGRVFDVDPRDSRRVARSGLGDSQALQTTQKPATAEALSPAGIPLRTRATAAMTTAQALPRPSARQMLLAGGAALAIVALGLFGAVALPRWRNRSTIGGVDPTATVPAVTQTSAPATPTADAGGVVPAPTETVAPVLAGRLVFTREFEPDRFESSEIVAVDLAGGTETLLTDNDVPDYLPRWSPVGESIAFTSIYAGDLAIGNYDIWVMNSDGSNPQPLFEYPPWDTYPAWSPDGDVIAFATTGETDGVANSEIHLLDAAGNLQRLTYNTGSDEWPAWSPDGGRIAFASNLDGDMGIYLLDLATGQTRMLVNTPAYETQPAWSPDGRWIAFTRKESAADGGDLWLVAPNGSLRQLTATGDAGEPAWSPDGRWLAFTRGIDTNNDGRIGQGDHADIWAISIDDGTLWPLVESAYHEWGASWAPPAGSDADPY